MGKPGLSHQQGDDPRIQLKVSLRVQSLGNQGRKRGKGGQGDDQADRKPDGFEETPETIH
ncbi:MAG: hypothetical protein A2Y36_10935 [Treponema sp. GWA1_62_8]|nr:MAG: hypothetical protein A2Y36_10935 [Treponema sp. GWA1_62_8]